MSTRTRPPKRVKQKPPTLLLRTSERSNFKRCHWQWERGYNDRLKPIIEAPALRFGTLVHKALELRYPPGIKRGPKPAETFERLYEAELKEAMDTWGFRDADDEWANALDIGVDILEAFIEKYGRDEEWQVISSEMTFKVPVYSPERPDGGYIGLHGEPLTRKHVLFHYVGTMDGVWKNRMDGGVRVIDWKTTKNDPTKVSHLILDEQATAYWTFGVQHLIRKKMLKPKDQQALDGMLYTFLRKAKRDPRSQNAQGHYLNKDGSVSKQQPLPMFHRELVYREEHSREVAVARAIREVRDMEAIRLQPREDRLIDKTPGSGATNHCGWCPFNDICELHEAGADWESLCDATMIEWDPYSAHEVKEEGKR